MSRSPFGYVYLAVDEPKGDPTLRASRDSTRRDRPTRQVVRRTTREVVRGQLVAVAGQRWRIEESFQAAKGLVGLDQHQVRRWTSWHRWTVLAMLAHAFLAVATAAQRDHEHTQQPAPTGLIEVTVAEFRRLLDALLLGAKRTLSSLLAWSRWRRRHQARARAAHYRAREH